MYGIQAFPNVFRDGGCFLIFLALRNIIIMAVNLWLSYSISIH